ncbi:MAG: hypothetical protein DLM67_16615 [Candidatus Nephthysia bennettiae]|uniref:PLL-like beta propeller domain-containing protein n=1 Tax=Candidatus Nephthysia bennettiae TaxID=3127016 RepID=A0A934K9Q5_9BACT|nr:hypothetical protein [Candidatus Dormibacteraeota bacterium]MBJ7613440.1 hypothetical protein [Candidatus Dormibacteraeota bacterium]PZR91110.1 MAG: hypothetical protein DLM67_16615 [Candidatus Dormibacteraeota bacterium]
MGPQRFARSLVRALLVPVTGLLAVSLVTANPVQAASDPAAQSSPAGSPPPDQTATPSSSSPSMMDGTPVGGGAAAALGRRVRLGTAESARLKKRAGAQPAAPLPLAYHGGQVENTPQVYLSLWGSDWKGAAYQSTISYLQGFFGNVGGSPWLNVTSQYCSGPAPASNSAVCQSTSYSRISNPAGQLRGTWVDTTPVTYNTSAAACGGSSTGDCDVMAAALRAARHFGPLPRGSMVMVFTPSGRSQPGFVASGWCAYHWASNSGVAFGYIPYMPDAGGSCGRNSVNSGGVFDGFSIVGGHEYAEAVTDPYPDSGWIDASGGENGDKCAWTFGLSNIQLGGRQYAVQPTWSNAANGCVFGAFVSQQGMPPPVPKAPPAASFSSLGGTLTSAPAATSWGPGRLDVVARGNGNTLVHRAFAGGAWRPWETVGGGQLTSEPAAVSWSPNRLDVFTRGGDGALWHTFSDGNRWFGWESLGGSLKAGTGPTVASWGAGRLDVFVTGTDNAVWHKWYAGGWSGWVSQGGSSISSPAAVSAGANVVDVFTQGPDNTLRHQAHNGQGWSAWQTFSGSSLSSAPAVAATGIDQMAVFVRGNGGLLSRNNWNGGSWSGFLAVGGGSWPTVSSATVQPDALTIDLFTQGNDGALWRGTTPVVT